MIWLFSPLLQTYPAVTFPASKTTVSSTWQIAESGPKSTIGMAFTVKTTVSVSLQVFASTIITVYSSSILVVICCEVSPLLQL